MVGMPLTHTRGTRMPEEIAPKEVFNLNNHQIEIF